MLLTDASLKRPIAMTTVILVMLLLGVLAYRRLGLDLMPKVDVPFVTVVTVYPGASPREIETEIAKKIEDAVVAIDGLKHVNTSCMQSVCQTFLEFDLDRDVDIAAMDVREKIGLIRNELPAAAEEPKVLKFNLNARPVVRLALTGDLTPDELYDYADNQLRDRLSTLAGVADVRLTGGARREVHVLLDRRKLAARGLTSAGVVRRLKEANLKVPAGNIKEGVREYTVMFDAEFDTVHSIGNLIVGNREGRRTRLRDVATIRMATEEVRTAAMVNGRPGVAVEVVKKGEANAVRVVNRVRREVAALRRQLPGGMDLVWFLDDGEFIESTVRDAWSNIVVGVLLTAAILVLFLQDVRAALIAFLSMPTSIVISFWAMGLFGYTLNTSTLLALGISVGVLVTNSIVVLENIARCLGDAPDARSAARTGTDRVAIAVLASASTNVVVFVPIALMSSLVGRFFIPFAVTITAATLVSLFISYTLTPILAGMFLKRGTLRRSGRCAAVVGVWQAAYSISERAYGHALSVLARMPLLPVAAVFAAFAGVLFAVAPRVGMDFFPNTDQGQLVVRLEFPSDFNLSATRRRTAEIAARLRKTPEVLGTLSVVGRIQGIIGQASEGPYLAEILVKLTPRTARTTNIETLRAGLRRLLVREPACLVSVMVPDIIGGSAKPVEMEISGPDLAQLDRLARQAGVTARESGGLVDIEDTVRLGKPEIRLLPRRAVLSDLGLPPATLGFALRGNLTGLKATTFRRGDRSYNIRVKMTERRGARQVSTFRLPTPSGFPLNITNVVRIRRDRVPVQVTRSEKRRVAKLFANLAEGMGLGTAVERLRGKVAAGLPGGYTVRFVGLYEKMAEAVADFRLAILTAVLLTYLLLAAVLESWTQPFLIMATLPLAYMGLILALFLTGMNMSMMGLLAGVMLIGIVVNNAILIMDEVNRLVRDGQPRFEAMLAAAPAKFRPIVMTSIAAALGMLPMALGRGLGGELRASCGVGAVGGILVSSVLSLFFVPLLYLAVVRRKAGDD
ncbi:MAG: efflux RND transporter permease subunit [Kiritimatiellaeota bacterium]|nr:efflux RND transporter permease subunit [Kiritimatiellota bacterium]